MDAAHFISTLTLEWWPIDDKWWGVIILITMINISPVTQKNHTRQLQKLKMVQCGATFSLYFCYQMTHSELSWFGWVKHLHLSWVRVSLTASSCLLLITQYKCNTTVLNCNSLCISRIQSIIHYYKHSGNVALFWLLLFIYHIILTY